jgi:DNA polymerase I-like protein with 3'-5' exonuclease and polymerase domains
MLVGCDLAQLEWRTAVELSGDAVGLAEIVEGQDTHELNRVAFDLPERRVAKFYLFRTIFRGSGFAFANDPDFMHVSTDPAYWDAIGVKFYTKYKQLDDWHKFLANEVLAGRPIVGPTGREWFIELQRDYRGNLKLPWTIFTNYPVQGTGADIMMVFRLSFWRRLCTLGLQHVCKVIQTVHDSLYVDCPKEHVKTIVSLFYDCLDDLVTNVCRVFKINWRTPLGGEVSIGMNQKDMKTVDRDLGFVV